MYSKHLCKALEDRVFKIFACTSCAGTLKSPVQCHCGSVFCRSCISKHQKSSKNVICSSSNGTPKVREDIKQLFLSLEKLESTLKSGMKRKVVTGNTTATEATTFKTKKAKDGSTLKKLESDPIIYTTRRKNMSNLSNFEDTIRKASPLLKQSPMKIDKVVNSSSPNDFKSHSCGSEKIMTIDMHDDSFSQLPATPPSQTPVYSVKSSLSRHKQKQKDTKASAVRATANIICDKKGNKLLNNLIVNEPTNPQITQQTTCRPPLLENLQFQDMSKKREPLLDEDSDSTSESQPLDLTVKLSKSQENENLNKRRKIVFQHVSPSVALDLSCKRLRSDDDEEEDESTTETEKNSKGSFNLMNQAQGRRNSNKKFKSSVRKSLDYEFLQCDGEGNVAHRRRSTETIPATHSRSSNSETTYNIQSITTSNDSARLNGSVSASESNGREKYVKTRVSPNPISKPKEFNSLEDVMTCRGDEMLSNFDMDAITNNIGEKNINFMGNKKRERSTAEPFSSSSTPNSPSKDFKKLRTLNHEEEEERQNNDIMANDSKIDLVKRIMESPSRRPPIAITAGNGFVKTTITPTRENDFDSDDSDDSFLASTPKQEKIMEAKLNRSRVPGETTSNNTLRSATSFSTSPLRQIHTRVNSTATNSNMTPNPELKPLGIDGGIKNIMNHGYKTPSNRPGCVSPPSAVCRAVEAGDLNDGFDDDDDDFEWSDFESKSNEDFLSNNGKENGTRVSKVETGGNEDDIEYGKDKTNSNRVANFQTPKQWQGATKRSNEEVKPISNLSQGMKGTSNNKTTAKDILDSPILGVPRKFVFCPTRLSKLQSEKLERFCRMCDGKITKDYSDDVTHLVLTLEGQRVPQTMKYLRAIAGKKWVVLFDWVEECIKQNRIVAEEQYETSASSKCDAGPRKSRRAKVPLFDGFSFFVLGQLSSSGTTSDQWRILISKLGGKVVEHPGEVTIDTLIVGDSLDKKEKENYQRWYEEREVVTVAWEWVLDCTLAYEILPMNQQQQYILTKMDYRKKLSHPILRQHIYQSHQFE